MSWFYQKHPDYEKLNERWDYANDHYTLSLIDKLSTYLFKKAQGESKANYKDRQDTADYTALMSTAVESISGMLFSVEDKAERSFGDLLGDPKEDGSVMNRLMHNVDGKGTNYKTLPKSAAIDLNIFQRIYAIVDGVTDESGATVKIIKPGMVEDWTEDRNGKLIMVKIKSVEHRRNSIKEEPVTVQVRYVYTFEGWERWEIVGDQDEPSLVDQNSYQYLSRDGSPILPVFRIELPLRRNLGYYLAKKNNAIFNQESARDNLLRNANFPKLQLVSKDDEFNQITKKLAAGSNALQLNPEYTNEHAYFSPSSEPAQISTEVLEAKKNDFLRTAYQMYGDSAREKTATEVQQDIASGIGAYLVLLASAVDEFENDALWRLEQVYFPDQRSAWGSAFVERTNDFTAVDIEARIQETKAALFGGDKLPATPDIMVSFLTDYFQQRGYEVEEEEITDAVNNYISAQERSNDVLGELGL